MTVELNDLELDKLIAYCESMIDSCDSPEESRVYVELLIKLGGDDE